MPAFATSRICEATSVRTVLRAEGFEGDGRSGHRGLGLALVGIGRRQTNAFILWPLRALQPSYHCPEEDARALVRRGGGVDFLVGHRHAPLQVA